MSKIYVPKYEQPSIWRVDSVGDLFAIITLGVLGIIAVCWATLL